MLDVEERDFLEPRLAHLLGLAEHQARDQQDLFAAWRLFFERLAESYPTVLAFEDMQWADESLLDFVEYLARLVAEPPILVVTLARPELLERRPTWGAGQRSFTSLYLEPLSREGDGGAAGRASCPGCPSDVRDRILARAEGVPLYAVETVRMLLDRGLLVQDGPVYRPTGEIETLEVPETLHALIAARLDGLSARGAAAASGRGGARQDVHDRRLWPRLAWRETRSSSRCLSHSSARRCWACRPIRARPSTASTASSRISCATSPTRRSPKRERRSRHLAAAEYLERRVRGRRGRGRRGASPPTTSPPTRRSPTPTTRPRSEARRRAMLVRAGRARRVARRGRRGDGATSSRRRRSTDEPPERASAARSGGQWPATQAIPTEHERPSRSRSRSTSRRVTRTPAARVLATRAGSTCSRASSNEAMARGERALAVLSADEPGEERRAAGRPSQPSATGLKAISTERWNGRSWRSTSPRRRTLAERADSCVAREGGRGEQPWPPRGGQLSSSAAAHDRARARLERGDAPSGTSSSPIAASGRTATATLSIPRRGTRLRPKDRAAAPRVGTAHGRGTVSPLHARPLGRGARGEQEAVHARSSSTPAGSC